ncbi:hypothetical protein GCM10028812_52830 [Ancylobacter sonchi]
MWQHKKEGAAQGRPHVLSFASTSTVYPALKIVYGRLNDELQPVELRSHAATLCKMRWMSEYRADQCAYGPALPSAEQN